MDYILENPNFATLLPHFHLLNTCSSNLFKPWPQLSNPELDLRFGSAIFENLELNFSLVLGGLGLNHSSEPNLSITKMSV